MPSGFPFSMRSKSFAGMSLDHGQPPMRRPIITPLGNRIATEASAMARIPLTIDHIKTGKYVLNIESVGLTQDQLCSLSDILNEVQFKLQFKLDEYVANGAKFGFLIYPPQRNVYVYRPGRIPRRLGNIQSVRGEPELPDFTLDLTESWQ
jgi:hypothetical protein